MKQFTVSTPVPFSHSLIITWTVDGQQQGTGSTFNLDTTSLSVGDHSLVLSISDPTTMVRSDLSRLLIAQRFWTITVTAAPTLQFSAGNYNAGEGDSSVIVTVNRIGDTS